MMKIWYNKYMKNIANQTLLRWRLLNPSWSLEQALTT